MQIMRCNLHVMVRKGNGYYLRRIEHESGLAHEQGLRDIQLRAAHDHLGELLQLGVELQFYLI